MTILSWCFCCHANTLDIWTQSQGKQVFVSTLSLCSELKVHCVNNLYTTLIQSMNKYINNSEYEYIFYILRILFFSHWNIIFNVVIKPKNVIMLICLLQFYSFSISHAAYIGRYILIICDKAPKAGGRLQITTRMMVNVILIRGINHHCSR